MTSDSSDLAARVASRLCHDLISPIGAISNGVELLALSGGGSAETELIAQSAGLAAARLRLYRIAFGATSGDQHVHPTEIRAIIDGFSPRTRISCKWDCPEGCPRQDAKHILLALLCLESALSHGGCVVVSHGPSSTTLRAEALRLRSLPGQWDHLADGRADLLLSGPPSEIQFALLAAALSDAGRTATVSLTDTTIELSF